MAEPDPQDFIVESRRLRAVSRVYGLLNDEKLSEELAHRVGGPGLLLLWRSYDSGHWFGSLHYTADELLNFVEADDGTDEPMMIMQLADGNCWKIERHWHLMPGPFDKFNGEEKVDLT